MKTHAKVRSAGRSPPERAAARRLRQTWLVIVLAMGTAGAVAETTDRSAALRRLVASYPEHLERIDGNDLVWQDGTRMPIDDGKGEKPFEDWLTSPDIDDMLSLPYPAGDLKEPPGKDIDPGRARSAAFFNKMYGDCTKGEVEKTLVEIEWLPRKSRQRLKVTTVNRVDERLRAISAELEALPERFDAYLFPSAGTFSCRPIAGTSRISAHGHGIAIDIALARSDYWRWSRPSADGSYAHKNRIPAAIVRIFEARGFIWGGKWHHYDTMHFEYRPELAGAAR